MEMKLRFLGGARNVTGSKYLLEANGARLLVDCGLFQEWELKGRNWAPFPVPPSSIEAVLLTHAHLDHCGLLPRLVRDGFRGRVYCTDATAEIARIMLADAGHLQEEDAEFKRHRHTREGRRGPYPDVPLYTVEDGRAVFPLFSPVRYQEPVPVADGIEATFYDAGHVLGSSSIKLQVRQDGQQRTLLFSGDVGRWNRPFLRDPTLFHQADYVLVESTYGDRLHEDSGHDVQLLADSIVQAVRDGGNLVIPSFALERAQEVLYYLDRLLMEGRMPAIQVWLDSPMALEINDVFLHHAELLDEEMQAMLRRGHSPFKFPGLKTAVTADESRAIAHAKGTVAIIAGSGMCTGGRIKHHLVDNISRPESVILFVGYQAQGTLGRQILDGQSPVRVLGQMHEVRARVVQLHSFSAHADRDSLLRWVSALQPAPRRVFVTHGESGVAERFAALLRGRSPVDVSVPAYGDVVSLS